MTRLLPAALLCALPLAASAQVVPPEASVSGGNAPIVWVEPLPTPHHTRASPPPAPPAVAHSPVAELCTPEEATGDCLARSVGTLQQRPRTRSDADLLGLASLSAGTFEPLAHASVLFSLAPEARSAEVRDYFLWIAEYALQGTLLSNAERQIIRGGPLALREAFADGEVGADEPRPIRFAHYSLARTLGWEEASASPPPAPTHYDCLTTCLIDVATCHPSVASSEQWRDAFDLVRREEDAALAEQHFALALEAAGTDHLRADLLYSRAASGGADSLYALALRHQPDHGPTVYSLAQRHARGLGRPDSLTARAAYWCLADRFHEVAATGDPRVERAALRTAAAYERAAPSPEDYASNGWRRGQVIHVASGEVSCTTRVR